jgi:predicted AlkP superfamily pyrophosphatase or phosphodiesterase
MKNQGHRVVTRRMMSILTMSILCACGARESLAQDRPAGQKHVVLVVWDGMRPDFVSEANCPTLWKLTKKGVTFRNHHSVYVSATNVNGTAIATGVYPGKSGIIANQEYRPEISSKRIIAVEDREVVRKGDEVSAGKYVAFPTIAELVRAAGLETVTATAKTVGLLQDRHLDVARDNNSVLVFSGQMLSAQALASVVALLGPFPMLGYAQKDIWTTKALTEIFWKDRVPAFSLLWLSEPDGTEHEAAPGSKGALAAIRSADDNLAAVLATLDRPALGGLRSTTDIFVVSDHGFSTIERSVDLRKILTDAGFSVTTEFTAEPKPGEVMLAGNGGTVLFYVIQHDTAVVRRLVEFLQQSDFAGVILTRDKLEGTFGLEQARIDNEHAPDVAMAFRWNEKKNQFDLPGMINADWNRKAGQGTHATLSRFDMHNMLIASGPDFDRGQTDDLPSGNVDLAPTILRILGIAPTQKMDGRVLSEAMNVAARAPESASETLKAAREFSTGKWEQTLRVAHVGSTIYLDEGNGSFIRKR